MDMESQIQPACKLKQAFLWLNSHLSHFCAGTRNSGIWSIPYHSVSGSVLGHSAACSCSCLAHQNPNALGY